MKHSASAQWKGGLKDGGGTVDSQSGALKGLAYSYKSRFEDETGKAGTNPEELIAAAHASCYAMQFSAYLGENGTPGEVNVSSVVEILSGNVTSSALTVEGRAPGIDAAKFAELAEKARVNCPISKALGAIKVTLDAKLVA
ncbi:MAG: OsmC family peroxiredoxin [Devosia sp.]